jgi:Protein of unknown function (DUF3558)
MRKLAALGMLVMSVSACHVQDGSTEARPQTTPSTIVDRATGVPIPLPFENRFPNRWNPANDGTSFEPCVAYSDAELMRFDIDPSQREDVALVDGQGTRGCNWHMPGTFSLGQVVTNSTSLDTYREGVTEVDWKQDLDVNGRRVGVFTIDYGASVLCATYVQSFGAGVVTNVVTDVSPGVKEVDACALVEEFSRAYIDKIPQ